MPHLDFEDDEWKQIADCWSGLQSVIRQDSTMNSNPKVNGFIETLTRKLFQKFSDNNNTTSDTSDTTTTTTKFTAMNDNGNDADGDDDDNGNYGLISINRMISLMNEIENDLKEENNNNDNKPVYPPNMKQFIAKPVTILLYLICFF